MNYDILKKIDNNTFDNFESLINNIKNKDKNIDNMFRVTAEGILKHLNEIECFVEDTNGFYNRIINNNKFQSAMLNKYKCDRKIMACLNEIKNSGNSSIHNNVDKFFDSKKSREHFTRLLFLCQNIFHIRALLTSAPGLRLCRSRPGYRQLALPAGLPW